MDTDCRVQIVVCCSHDGRRGRSGRQPANVDALSIDRIVIHDLARDARDKRGFTSASLLVGRAKPVPAFRLVGLAGLSRIDHEAILFLSDKVHPRAGGEIIRRLGTAVKHDDQRKRSLLIAARDEEPVGAAPRRTAVRAFDEPGALRHDVRCGQRGALYTSQPGVSKQLRLLEQELGTEIFARSGQKLLGLTEAGTEIYEIARRILMASTELQEAAHHFSNRDSGRLTVATTHLHARYSLLPVIQRFSKKYPAVHLELIQSSPDEIDAMLVDGAADIDISTSHSTAYPDLVRLKAKVLYRCLITPKNHPLLEIGKPSLRDIARYPLIVYDSRLSSGWIVQETFEKKGIQPNIVLTAVDADVIKAYVGAGLGVSILQELAYDPAKDTELDALPARHLFPPMETYVILHRAKYMRQFTFDFIAMFAPRWRREVVKKALSS